jgi:hypothetical protein
MHSGWSDTAQPVPGFPIRKSPLQRSVDSSTRLIAVSHVLHRLLTPRHPPCALHNLTTSQRCSRSLCNSQGSTLPTRVIADSRASEDLEPRTLPENSTVCAAGLYPSPSFPRHRSGRYWMTRSRTRPNSQRSTLSAHTIQRTSRGRHGTDQTPERDLVCAP